MRCFVIGREVQQLHVDLERLTRNGAEQPLDVSFWLMDSSFVVKEWQFYDGFEWHLVFVTNSKQYLFLILKYYIFISFLLHFGKILIHYSKFSLFMFVIGCIFVYIINKKAYVHLFKWAQEGSSKGEGSFVPKFSVNTSEPQMSAVSLTASLSVCMRKCQFTSTTSFQWMLSCISSHCFQIYRSPGSNLKNHLSLPWFWSCIPATMFFTGTLHLTMLGLLVGSSIPHQCPLHNVKPGTGKRER